MVEVKLADMVVLADAGEEHKQLRTRMKQPKELWNKVYATKKNKKVL